MFAARAIMYGGRHRYESAPRRHFEDEISDGSSCSSIDDYNLNYLRDNELHEAHRIRREQRRLAVAADCDDLRDLEAAGAAVAGRFSCEAGNLAALQNDLGATVAAERRAAIAARSAAALAHENGIAARQATAIAQQNGIAARQATVRSAERTGVDKPGNCYSK